MKAYNVYLGSYEQYKYTYDAKNQKELKKLLISKWPSMNGRWYKVDASGCPKGSKRFLIKTRGYFGLEKTNILIIPDFG
jgi:hypothetical protein